jgi:5'-nucleotidase
VRQENKKQILLTNDDGIESPGLWAAAEALAELGYVTVAAPSDHFSASGRGYVRNSTGCITTRKLKINNQEWEAYGVGGSPSQTVVQAILEIMPHKPDLVVAGINYGENVGTDITFSGTVMAAMEGASLGVAALAVSVQILIEEWDTFHPDVNFNTSAYFTHKFAKILLEKKLPDDVDALNIVVPKDATRQTPWRITRLARSRYYNPYVLRNGDWNAKAKVSSHPRIPPSLPHDTDIYTALVEKIVSVTPLSLDLTSRVDIDSLEDLLRKNK